VALRQQGRRRSHRIGTIASDVLQSQRESRKSESEGVRWDIGHLPAVSKKSLVHILAVRVVESDDHVCSKRLDEDEDDSPWTEKSVILRPDMVAGYC
jgi:hypothetical protein